MKASREPALRANSRVPGAPARFALPLLTAVLAAGTVACASPPEAPAATRTIAPTALVVQVPIVLEGTGVSPEDLEALSPEAAGLVRQALRALEVGDDERCRAALTALAALETPATVTEFRERLEAVVDGRMLQRTLEESARVEPMRFETTIGDVTEFEIVLENRSVGGSQGNLSIPWRAGAEIFSTRPRTRTQLLATVTVVDLGPYGSEARRTETLPVRFVDDCDLEAGQVFRLPFSLEGIPSQGAVVRTFQVSADLYPAEVSWNGRPVFVTRLQFAEGECMAFPAGFEGIVENPLEALEGLLGRGDVVSERSIVPTALLVPREQRSLAVKKLARALLPPAGADARPLPPLRSRAIVAALRQLTGDRSRGLDPSAWLAWASRR